MLGLTHGLINCKDPKANCRHLKILISKGTFAAVTQIRVVNKYYIFKRVIERSVRGRINRLNITLTISIYYKLPLQLNQAAQILRQLLCSPRAGLQFKFKKKNNTGLHNRQYRKNKTWPGLREKSEFPHRPPKGAVHMHVFFKYMLNFKIEASRTKMITMLNGKKGISASATEKNTNLL